MAGLIIIDPRNENIGITTGDELAVGSYHDIENDVMYFTDGSSIYEWEGKLCDDAEVLCVVKTTPARFEALREKVVELHPYSCPEVIALPVAAGHRPYLDWVREIVGG